MSSPEVDSHGIKWLFAHGTITTVSQSRDNPGDHRWSHDTPGAGKGYEVTWICSPSGVTGGSGGSSGHTALKHGGPNHSGDCGGGYSEDGSCCCWYDIGIRANGDLQFQTERPHPSNHDFDGHPLFNNVGHEMEGHDTGLKIVAYPQITGGTAEDGGIHIKFYINSNALTSGQPNNNWRLAADIFDEGQILGDGYEWPDYQELEVRNSDTDESGFYNDSVYIRMLTDADLQALRSGSTGGGGPPPPPPDTGGPIVAGPGAVINTTIIQSEGANIWNKLNAETVIKDTLNRQILPARGIDFLNTLYVVIGPVDVPFKDINAAPTSTGSTEGPNAPGTRDVSISLTLDLVFGQGLSGSDARKEFDVAASEEMIEVQTDPFPDHIQGAWYAESLGEDPIREIGDTPCDFAPGTEGNQPYADGLQVEAYWSNEHHDCIIPTLTSGGTGDDNNDNLTYHGGPVMKHPTIWMIFWGSDWNTRTATPTRNQLIVDIRDKLLGTDNQYFNSINQYSGCGVPVWGGAVTNTHIAYPPNQGPADWSQNLLESVIADTLTSGLISLKTVDFMNTQFLIIPEANRADFNEDIGFGAFHYDYVATVTFPPLEPGETPSEPTQTFPEVGGRHDCYRPTINVPGSSGTGTGGGTLPPDTTIPPPGATVIKPIVSYAVIPVIDSSTSVITAVLPDWDNNNIVTRSLALALIHSQVNTDQFARFGPPGWSRDTGTNNQIGESPCIVTVTGGVTNADVIHIYGDDLGVQAYWSNLANNCIVPGRGDIDLGTSTDIKYHNGRIMKEPLVVLIFWGPGWLSRTDDPSVMSITEDVKEKLLDNDSQYFSQLSQYGGVRAPQFGASVINTSVPFTTGPPAVENQGPTITVEQARAVVKSTLQNGSLPTALIDFDNIWFCVIPDYPTDLLWPDGSNRNIIEWNDVFQPTIVVPGEAPEDPGGSPDPTDLTTIAGVLSFKRDINSVRLSSCAGTEVIVPPPPPDPITCPAGQHYDTTEQRCVDDFTPPPPPVGGTAKFYEVTSTSSQKEISNESSSDNRTQITQKINASSSPMANKLLKQADVLLRKESGTTATTPLIYFKIWDGSNNVVYTSPTTFTPNELSTSFASKTFDCSTNTHTLVNGDRVGCEFTGTDPDEFVWTAYTTSENSTTGGSYEVYKEGSSYDDQTSRNLSCTLWI